MSLGHSPCALLNLALNFYFLWVHWIFFKKTCVRRLMNITWDDLAKSLTVIPIKRSYQHNRLLLYTHCVTNIANWVMRFVHDSSAQVKVSFSSLTERDRKCCLTCAAKTSLFSHAIKWAECFTIADLPLNFFLQQCTSTRQNCLWFTSEDWF